MSRKDKTLSWSEAEYYLSISRKERQIGGSRGASVFLKGERNFADRGVWGPLCFLLIPLAPRWVQSHVLVQTHPDQVFSCPAPHSHRKILPNLVTVLPIPQIPLPPSFTDPIALDLFPEMLSCNYAPSFYKSQHYMVNKCIKHCSGISPGVRTHIIYGLSSSNIFIYPLQHAYLCTHSKEKVWLGTGPDRGELLFGGRGGKGKHIKGSEYLGPECKQAQGEHPNSETIPFCSLDTLGLMCFMELDITVRDNTSIITTDTCYVGCFLSKF